MAEILGISIRTINGKVERKRGVVKEFMETLDYRERRLSVEEMKMSWQNGQSFTITRGYTLLRDTTDSET